MNYPKVIIGGAANIVHQAQARTALKSASHLRKTTLALAVAGALAFPALLYAAPGDPVGGEFQVNTNTGLNQNSPAIGADADGDFVVAWQSDRQDGSSDGIFAQRYNTAGVPQGGEFRVNTTTAGSQARPAIALDADGDFVVVWNGNGVGDNGGIFAQRYNSVGVPQGGEFRVNTFTFGAQFVPDVALDADGDFVVAWQSDNQDDSGYNIFAQRYNAAGVPQGGEFTVNTTTAGNQRAPDVALDADGDFVVAWTSPDGGGGRFDSGIFAQRYNAAGVPQGGEFQVNTFTTSFQTFPAVALDADGDFVVTWSSANQDPDYGIFAQRYNTAGVGQGGEFRVNTTTAGSQTAPAIALDADGDFVVTWESYGQDGSRSGIFAQRYNTAGVRQGGEFLVNTTTDDLQLFPAIALDADGDFVVAWASPESGSFNFLGIFAQRFEGPQKVFCNGLSASFVGTPGPDTLTGTAGRDVIHGQNGNDTINGLGGNDVLCGGRGIDILNGGRGNDQLLGFSRLSDSDNDTLNGSAGFDTAVYLDGPAITANLAIGVISGQGSDRVTGVENVTGTVANDTLIGNDSTNLLDGRSGNDILRGKRGNDLLLGGAGNDALNGGAGIDLCDAQTGTGDTATACEAVAGVP